MTFCCLFRNFVSVFFVVGDCKNKIRKKRSPFVCRNIHILAISHWTVGAAVPGPILNSTAVGDLPGTLRGFCRRVDRVFLACIVELWPLSRWWFDKLANSHCDDWFTLVSRDFPARPSRFCRFRGPATICGRIQSATNSNAIRN